MNDHNLDDLIIDNIEPKNSKTKSFLTIIALLIVVLIVAIILTKIILKNPNADRLALEEDNTELISPELTLQNVSETPTTKVEPKAAVPAPKPQETLVKPPVKAPVKTVAPVVKPVIEPKKPEVVAKPTVEITKEFSQAPKVETPKVETSKVEKAPAKLIEKAKERPAPRPVNIPKPIAATQTYYIQVGSFSKTPSSRFLSVITNSGFTYKITPPSATGTKKLLIGPYKDRESANNALVRVKDRINKSAFVIKK